MKKLLLIPVAMVLLSVLANTTFAQLNFESLRNAGKFTGLNTGIPRLNPAAPAPGSPARTSPARVNPSSILGSGNFNGLSGIEVPRSRFTEILGERSTPTPPPPRRFNPGAVINPDILRNMPEMRLPGIPRETPERPIRIPERFNPGSVINPDLLGNLPRMGLPLNPRLPGTAPAAPEGIVELPPGIVTPRPDGTSYEGDVIRVIPPRRMPVPAPRDLGPVGGAIEVPLPSPGSGTVIEVYPPTGVIVGTPVPTPAIAPPSAPATEVKPIPKLGIKGQIIANYGMRLVKVKANGLAAKAGLEAGDIIVRIGNASIVSLESYDSAMAIVAADGYADFLVDDVRKRSQSNRLVIVRVNFEPAEPVVDR